MRIHSKLYIVSSPKTGGNGDSLPLATDRASAEPEPRTARSGAGDNRVTLRLRPSVSFEVARSAKRSEK